MKPIKPKFENTVKLELNISKRTKEILTQYSKYTKYTEGEIIDMIASEITNDDENFLEWLKSRRFQRKISDLIFQETIKGDDAFEETNETCEI